MRTALRHTILALRANCFGYIGYILEDASNHSLERSGVMKARECVRPRAQRLLLQTNPFPYLEARRHSGHGADDCFSSKGASK
jgi:hypothetical protein